MTPVRRTVPGFCELTGTRFVDLTELFPEPVLSACEAIDIGCGFFFLGVLDPCLSLNLSWIAAAVSGESERDLDLFGIGGSDVSDDGGRGVSP